MKVKTFNRLPIVWGMAMLSIIQAQTAYPDSLVIYSNSFEVPEDTIGWIGLSSQMLVEDPAPGQGSRSLLIGGDCIQPTAWIDIPCSTGDGLYRLSFWGNAGDIVTDGGSIILSPADWNVPLYERIEIYADSLDWTFYQAENNLHLGEIDTLRIQIWVGGIRYDDVQIDGLEVVTYPVLGSHSVAEVPTAFCLRPAFPNPFNPVSTIRYELPQGSNVSLIVYEILGREVARLVDGYVEPGYYQAQWDGRNSGGRELPSGIYIARLATAEYSKAIKMVLLK